MIIPESGTVARRDSEEVLIREINGIPLVKTSFKEATGVPEPKEGVVYIVSRLVKEDEKIRMRDDVMCPDTGSTAVRVNGQPVGVTRLTY